LSQQEEENTAHTGEEKAFTSLTTTVHFRTVYAHHEGKIYLTENRSEEKSSFFYITGDRIYEQISFIIIPKTCFSSS
jgi:hypothetical protein